METYRGIFSVLTHDEDQRIAVLWLLISMEAKKIVHRDGVYYIYVIEDERRCKQFEERVRSIVGSENYKRFNSLPAGFYLHQAVPVTL